MVRNLVAIVMSVCLVLPLHGYQQKPPTVQEQIGKISKGSLVEVKTRNKAMKKVKGRLGEVTAEGFEVQVTDGQKVDTVKLLYADVTDVNKPMTKTGKIVWTSVLVVGGLMAAAAISCGVQGGCSQ